MASGTIKSHCPINIGHDYENVAMYTTLTYTGIDIIIPPRCSFSVTVMAQYLASKPETLTINNSSTNANAQIATGGYNGVAATVSLNSVNLNNVAVHLPIWAKYANAGTNGMRVFGYAIPFD